MKVDLAHIQTIFDLAKVASTGVPQDLACKLGISTRSLSDLVRFMRDKLEIPIVYDRMRESYFLQEKGHVNFKFQKNQEIAKQIIKFIETSIPVALIIICAF